MLKGLTSTFRENCNKKELTYNEYIVINNEQVPIRAKLSDDCYENGNFIGSFILKTIQFETSNDVDFKEKEFEYYKVVDGESIKIGTFITTEIEDNDTTELIKVVGMDYGLKTQVEYTSALDYESGNVTLMDVWNECCQLSGLESGVDDFENSNFIVDSDQFTGTGATIRDVFIGIALSSGSFIKVMNDDKIYPIFKTHTEDLLETTINTQGTIKNVLEIDKIKELSGNTFQQTYTGKNLCGIPNQTVTKSGVTITIKDGEITLNGTASAGATQYLVPIDTTTLNGNYTLNVIYISGSMSGSTNRNFNVRKASDNSYIFGTTFQTSNNYSTYNFTSSTQIIFGIYGANTAKFTNYKFKVQLVQGTSSDYNYEPYVGGTSSPNPDYPQPIENVTGLQNVNVCGKNLFDVSKLNSITPDSGITYINDTTTGTVTLNGTTTKNTFLTYLTQTFDIGDIVSLSANNTAINSNVSIRLSDISGNIITPNVSLDTINKVSNNITLTNTYGAFQIRIASGTTLNNFKLKPQLEKGSTATEYEPYKFNTYEVNLGKNLFNKDNVNANKRVNSNNGTIGNMNGISCSDYIDIDGAKSLYLSGNTTSQNLTSYQCAFYNSSKTFISGITTTINAVMNNRQIDVPNNAKYIIFNFANADKNKMQLEKGTQATSYSPYFTPIELNKIGDYEDSIKKSTGKNLFDKNNANLINCSVTSSGISNTSQAKMLYIPIQPNTEYTISKIQSARFRAGTTTDIPAAGVQISNYISSDNSTSITITTGATSKYLFAFVYISTADTLTEQQILDSIQVEIGETATSYEPYGKVWYIEKNIGKVVLDGSTTWDSQTAYTGYYRYKRRTAISTTSNAGLNNRFIQRIDQAHGDYEYLWIQSTSGGIYIQILQSRLSDGNVSTFQTWLSNNNVEVLYILATPTYTTITNTELINQLESIALMKGTNNIIITSENLTGELKLTYWDDNFEVIEDYTQLEDKRDTHPISCVRLGLSNVEGENVDLIDPELVEQYGENWLILNDNPFAYTQAKREQLITAIFNKVKGFGYSSFVSKTSFKPYLTCGDLVKFKNKNGDLVNSILLRYTHDYKDNDMQIELSAPSETSATVNYLYPLQAIDIAKRTEIIVDKDRVQIEALTGQVTNIQGGLDNTYTKEEMNQLIQTATTGITNNFINSGGNNLLRNTGLWFEDRSVIDYMYPTSDLYPSDELFMSADPHWEYWKGNAKKIKEDKASNLSGILLQTGYLEQQQQVRNGTYTLSFKYRKLIELSTVNVQINDKYIELNQTGDNEIIEVGEITANNVSIKLFSDTDDSCVIYDLMLNAGSEKAEYSQHQNETTTDTVNISKGITISSSDTNTTFKANTDGIRIYNSRDMDTPVTDYTDTGMNTNRMKVKEEAEIVKVLWKDVGNNTWITRL